MKIMFDLISEKELAHDEGSIYFYKVGPLWSLWMDGKYDEGEESVFYDEDTEPKAIFERLEKREDWKVYVDNAVVPEDTIVIRTCPHCGLSQKFFLDMKTFLCRGCQKTWCLPASKEKRTVAQVIGVIKKI
jgi:hypothetical protein